MGEQTTPLGWLSGQAQPSRWHLILIWIMILFCAGFHAATGEPLLHALPWFGGA